MNLKELTKFLDALVWSHEQVRCQNPEVSRFDRITETANVLLERCDLGSLALVAAAAVDRMTELLADPDEVLPIWRAHREGA